MKRLSRSKFVCSRRRREMAHHLSPLKRIMFPIVRSFANYAYWYFQVGNDVFFFLSRRQLIFACSGSRHFPGENVILHDKRSSAEKSEIRNQ